MAGGASAPIGFLRHLPVRYVSTRGETPALGFSDVLLAGLAADGGLYVPENWPTVTPDTIAGFAGRPYADVAFDGYRPPSFLASAGASAVGVEFTTMSKGYNMAGWRVGFCCGNREMIKALATIKGYYDYGMFQAIQIAAIMALRNGDAGMENQAHIYQSRRDALCESLNRLGWNVTPPKASMFCWVPIPEPWRSRMTTMDFGMLLLEKGNVAVSPGSGFGPAGEGFFRMSLVENEARLRQAVRQIQRCLREAESRFSGPSGTDASSISTNAPITTG